MLEHREPFVFSLLCFIYLGCVHELNTAKASGIPIITVIDQDHFQQVSEILCLIEAM